MNNCTLEYDGFLRCEAQPFNYEELNENQKIAFGEIIKRLKLAINVLSEEKAHKIDTNNPAIPPIYAANWNPIVFLSGERGSGKTSLLLTMMIEYSKYIADAESKFDRDLDNNLNELQKRLVWLEPLDMDPLPGPTNLLAAILARIEEAIQRFYKKGYSAVFKSHRNSYIEPYPEYEKSIMDLNKFQRDVALAWDGNVVERAANVDPDTFAVEVLRAENSRISLNYRFRTMLNNLAKTIFHRLGAVDNPLFILPVDDFDLNPVRCVELMRLIRMISVPRLFTIILGNTKIVQSVFQLKIRNELSSVGSPESIIPRTISLDPMSITHRRPFSTIPTETSSNAVRKLIPPTHIVSLESPDVEDGFSFKPSRIQKSIEELLSTIPIEINIASSSDEGQIITGRKVNNLAQFFKTVNLVEDEGDNEKNLRRTYCASAFFNLPLRHLQDIWRYLQQNNNHQQLDQKNRSWQSIEFANRIFRDSVQEDTYLTPDLVEDLKSAANPDFEGYHQLNIERITANNDIGPEVTARQEGRVLIARQAKDWHIKYMTTIAGRETVVKLSRRTEAAMVLLHDLLNLKMPRAIQDSLMKQVQPLEWLYTKWDLGSEDQSVIVRWHTPSWSSFWQCDFLRRGWNDTLRWLRKIEPNIKDVKTMLDAETKEENKKIEKSLDFHYFKAAYLAFSWIKLSTIIIMPDESSQLLHLPTPKKLRNKLIKPNSIKSLIKKLKNPSEEYLEMLRFVTPQLKDWLDLISELSNLTNMAGNSPLSRELIHGWLISIACMIAPESGMPSTVAVLFINDDNLRKFWSTPEISRQIRWHRANYAAEFFKKGCSYALMAKLFNPKPIEQIKMSEKAYEIKKDENENWFKDHTHRRYAINMLFDGILCPSLEDFKRLSQCPEEYADRMSQHGQNIYPEAK